MHEHTFLARQGGTLVGDRVEYAAPGGWFVQKFFVAPDLERIFDYRGRALEGIFKAGAGRSIASMPKPAVS